ncbi:SH3 domain-containing protein [Neobacillus drentensis]|uniref:SH3 domain-containing protein n=1 Tax=Neobacillus drentensis TaxID=220684 RepID=UPI002FFF55A5
MVTLTEELIVNGELILSRKETYGKKKQVKSVPVFTSRMERREYYQSIQFDIRNVLDIKGFLKDIRANWNTYVSQVSQWIQNSVVKKLVVTGIFTVVLGIYTLTANAGFIQEYTYQVKSGENIETIAAKHGVTAQEILDANGLSSIDGKKILLPKVEDRTVTATTLNVRSQPNTKSSIIGTYKKGDVVKVAFVENGWAAILIKGRVCFVSAAYLSQTPAGSSTVESQAKTMYVTASSLRVRAAAFTDSAVLGSLKLNDRVSVISTSKGWAQIKFSGKTAFVSAAYLTNNVPTNTTNESNKNNNTTNESDKNNSTTISSSEYVIKSGDTFTKISKALGVSASSIQALNPTVNPSKLKIGQTIKVPVTTTSTTTQIRVTAQIGGVDADGTFRFITSDGSTYCAKAKGNLKNELFNHQGKEVTLTLEGKRGQQMTLISLQ